MSLPQYVSVISITVLSLVATIIGIQIIFLLKELKHTLSKLNSAIDTTETAMKRFSQPVSNFLGLVEGLKQSTKVIETINTFLSRHSSPKPPVNVDL